MKLFKNGEKISKYFDLCYDKLRKIISGYNYVQLKDFSDDEIKTISRFGELNEVIIDFENPSYTAQSGKEQIYSGFTNYNGQREYYWTETLIVTVKVQILQGEELTKYQTNTEMIFFGGKDIEVNLLQEDDEYFISFDMRFLSDEMKKLTPARQKEAVNNSYKDHIANTQSRLATLNKEIREFNVSLFKFVKEEIKKKVDSDSLLAGFSEAIGVQLVAKQENKKGGQRISILPKKLETALPDKKVYNGYYFDRQNYYLLLKVLREHIKATEILPKPIQKLSDEELIRDTILWALNENFIVATGETFRAAGKTDILVNFEDRSAFIAECKIWRGNLTFDSALYQLYGYLTWHDCKIALIFFNLENKNFGQLLNNIEKLIGAHKNFISKIKKADNEWECVFKKETDYSENLTLNIFVADYCLRK